MALSLVWPAAGGPLVLGMPFPLSLGPPAPGLTRVDPAQTLVVPVFLPPPPPPSPPPAVAKLHQKTPLLCVNCSISTICQVEGSHQAGSSRMPPREKQTCWLALWPPQHTWGQGHLLCSCVLEHTASLGGCQHVGPHCSLFSGVGLADSAANPTQAHDPRGLLVTLTHVLKNKERLEGQKTYPCAPSEALHLPPL